VSIQEGGMSREKVIARGLDRPAHWRQIVRIDRWGRTQRSRRVGLLFGMLAIAFTLWSSIRTLHLIGWPEVALMVTLGPLTLFALGVRQAWLGLDKPGLEDRALTKFDAEMGSLTPQEREAVFLENNRQLLRNSNDLDERARERCMQAESTAFRVLRLGLPLCVAVYWAVCFWIVGADNEGHRGLVMGAVAASWSVFGVLILPVVIRMWSDPDEVGEAKVVATKREA
jgi:hypothetical protein